MPAAAGIFEFHQGTSPILISVPHDGRELPLDIRERMTPAGLDIPDTDWFVRDLYAFATALGASMIIANFSRYVVDLNRAADDGPLYPGQLATGLCPHKTFAGHDIYVGGSTVSTAEKTSRIQSFWQPYHDRIAATLAELRERFGYALLWDAHSIPSEVPDLFSGVLPVLNIGTFDEQSADSRISSRAVSAAEKSVYDSVVNARFKGGYITRHYGDPAADVHALQLEIAQRAYMDEDARRFDETKATSLRATVRAMLEAFVDAAKRHYQ